MKTLTSLTAVAVEAPATAPADAGPATVNTQSTQAFWRRLLTSRTKVVAQSSAGGRVEVSVEDLWKLFEQHDPKLAVPVKSAGVAS
jgi:hypothetical protein